MNYDLLINRIAAGYIITKQQGKIIHIRYPSQDVLYSASEIYNLILRQAEEEQHLTDDDIFPLLYDLGFWNDEKEVAYSKNLTYEMEQFKVRIYEQFARTKERETIRLYLNRAREVYEQYSKDRHLLDHATCEGIANFAKWIYIIENSCFYPNGTLVDWSFHNLSTVMNIYYDSFITENQIRQIAKNEPWSSIWSASKRNNNGVFKKVGTELTHDQKRLILWSSMYDNVSESSDCPIDKIIEDDDALDGWLIVKRKERETETLKSQTDKRLSDKISKADEIYLVADNIEEAREVEKLNDARAASIKRSRIAQLKREGEVHEIHFQDSRQKIQIALNQKGR